MVRKFQLAYTLRANKKPDIVQGQKRDRNRIKTCRFIVEGTMDLSLESFKWIGKFSV